MAHVRYAYAYAYAHTYICINIEHKCAITVDSVDLVHGEKRKKNSSENHWEWKKIVPKSKTNVCIVKIVFFANKNTLSLLRRKNLNWCNQIDEVNGRMLPPFLPVATAYETFFFVRSLFIKAFLIANHFFRFSCFLVHLFELWKQQMLFLIGDGRSIANRTSWNRGDMKIKLMGNRYMAENVWLCNYPRNEKKKLGCRKCANCEKKWGYMSTAQLFKSVFMFEWHSLLIVYWSIGRIKSFKNLLNVLVGQKESKFIEECKTMSCSLFIGSKWAARNFQKVSWKRWSR